MSTPRYESICRMCNEVHSLGNAYDHKWVPPVKWLCGHCGQEKHNQTGLCSHCHRFPVAGAPSILKPRPDADMDHAHEMPDSYTGDPLSVAECGQHGVYDIREIRCPKCASVADHAEKAAEEIAVEVSCLGGSSRTRMAEIIRAAYAKRDAERERSVRELLEWLEYLTQQGVLHSTTSADRIAAVRKAFGMEEK